MSFYYFSSFALKIQGRVILSQKESGYNFKCIFLMDDLLYNCYFYA